MQLALFKGKKKKKEGFIGDLSEELINVELMISNIEASDTNISVEEEKEALEKLKQEIDDNSFTGEKMGTSLIGVFQSMTDRLMNIKSRLMKYENLILLINKASYLENACKSGEVSKDLSSYVSLCLELLKDLNEQQVNVISKNKDEYKDIYRIIYEFIKIEIINTLESKVLESVRSQKTAIYYINSIMKEEINAKKKYAFNNPKLLSRLDMLTSKNTSSNLASDIVSKDVIFTIALIDNEEEVLKTLNSKIDGIKAKYSGNLEEINTFLNSDPDYPVGKIVQSKIDLEHHRQKLKETNKELTKKFISLIISTTLVAALGANLPNIGKAVYTKYATTTEIYETGKEPISLTSYEKKNAETKRTLYIYGKTYKSWGENKTDYKTYDVTGVIMESGSEEDYLYIDVDSFGLKASSSKSETVTEEAQERRQLTVVKQDYVNGSVLNEDRYRTFLIIAYLVLAFESILETIGPLGNLIQCIKLMNESDSEVSFINRFDKELKELIKECKKYIKSNKDLEKEYYNIYNTELKYLTDSEIEDKLKALISQNDEYTKSLKAYKE